MTTQELSLVESSNNIERKSEYVPEEVLFALTQPPAIPDKLGPPTRNRNINMSSIPARKAPANVWNHKRKDKFKHLIEQAPCFCGAGRDISFLYDLPANQHDLTKRDTADDKSKIRNEKELPKPAQLPTSLVPDEYHVVKSRGVLGLEYYKEDSETSSEFSTKVEDHEKHLVMFPSMKPTSRFEVIHLKDAMEGLLKKMGVESDVQEKEGTSQMHNLVNLVKAEQKIYNLVFHELIRQVTIECVERGEVLSAVRQRYADLLSHVPLQIKSLHEEVLAQRALDRRLTEELVRFRSQIFQLTRELTEVKEHDKQVTEQAKKAQEDLRSALEESQRNASLLNEYRELYELQRIRLEAAVQHLAAEKELWSTAAYSLAIKVIEENSLTTTKRLHVSEKSWSKLAQHFTVLLSDKDTEMLTLLQSHKEKWRDLVETFDLNLKELEGTIVDDLGVVKRGIEYWVKYFKKELLNEYGHFVKAPSIDTAKSIQQDIKQWITNLQNQVDKYSGSILLENTEALAEIEVQIKGWTECALEIFVRHKKGEEYPPDYESMSLLNEVHKELMNQFNLRLSGENGVARGVISLSTIFENWDVKLTNALHGGRDVPIREWMVFFESMDEWMENVVQVESWVGSPGTEAQKASNLSPEAIITHDAMKKTHQWAMSTNNAIDSTDAKLVGQVSTIHAAMVKWMVNMLMRLAPDREGTSEEALTVAHQNIPSINALREEAQGLFLVIDSYSLQVYNCCEGIVQKRVIQKMSRGELNPDSERQELIQLREEAYYWVQTANLMLTQLTGEPVAYDFIDAKFHAQQGEKAREPTFATTTSSVSEPTGPPPKPGEEPRVETVTEETAAETMPEDKAKDESSSGEAKDESVEESKSETTQGESSESTSQAKPSTASDEPAAPLDETGREPQTESTENVTEPVASSEETKPTDSDQKEPEVEEEKTDAAEDVDMKTEEEGPRPPTTGSLLEPPGLDDDRSSLIESPAVSIPTAASPADSLKPGKREEFGHIQIIGPDENTQMAVLTQPTASKDIVYESLSKPPTPAVAVLNSQVATDKKTESPTIKSYEALATVDRLQAELILTEQRAQKAEDIAEKKMLELNSALERIRALERKVDEMEVATSESLDKPSNMPPPDKFVAPHPPAPSAQRPPSAKSRPGSAVKAPSPGLSELKVPAAETVSESKSGTSKRAGSSAGSSRSGSRPTSRSSTKKKSTDK